MIHLIRQQASSVQIAEMLEMLGTYIKLAVDVRRGIVAGGGALHADCESVLLENGSQQEDIWGADWNPATREVSYEALINIRPRQGNRSLELRDPLLRNRIAFIVRSMFGGVADAESGPDS